MTPHMLDTPASYPGPCTPAAIRAVLAANADPEVLQRATTTNWTQRLSRPSYLV